MKKLIIILGCVAFVIILSGAEPDGNSKADAAAPAVDEGVSQIDQATESLYMLKEYNKRLAVFENGKNEPVYISSVFVSELPKADRELMKNGIPAPDEKTLKRLLEDYCS